MNLKFFIIGLFLSLTVWGNLPEDHLIEIRRATFQIKELEIRAGDSVTWENLDRMSHDVTSVLEPESGGWRSGILRREQVFTKLFEEEGVFDYYCRFHSRRMKGRIIVRADNK